MFLLVVGSLFLAQLAADDIHVDLECAVSSVVDGDTFRCSDGTTIRVFGVDAPAINHDLGPASKASTISIIQGMTLGCEKIGMSFGRIVAICYLAGTDIAELLVKEGFARDCPKYSMGRYSCLEDYRHFNIEQSDHCIP